MDPTHFWRDPNPYSGSNPAPDPDPAFLVSDTNKNKFFVQILFAYDKNSKRSHK